MKVTDVVICLLAEKNHGLIWLDIGRCAKLTDIGVEMITERCTGLQSLIIDNCPNISTEVRQRIAIDHPRLRLCND